MKMNLFKKFLKNKVNQKSADPMKEFFELREKTEEIYKKKGEDLIRISNRCSPMPFVYDGMDDHRGLIFLKAEVDAGEIGVELKDHSNVDEVESTIKQIYFDYGYIREKLSLCYRDLVFKRFYKDFGAYYHFEFTNGEERIEIRYHINLGNAKESVYKHISSQQNVLLGILKDAGSNQFQIDDFNVIAFLKANHGKKIEIKIV